MNSTYCSAVDTGLFVYTNGQVGVNTPLPNAPLEIRGGYDAGLNDVLWLTGGAVGSDSGPRMVFHDLWQLDTYPDWRMGEIGALYDNFAGGGTYGCSLVFRVCRGNTTTA